MGPLLRSLQLGGSDGCQDFGLAVENVSCRQLARAQIRKAGMEFGESWGNPDVVGYCAYGLKLPP